MSYTPSEDELRQIYVGKDITDVAKPCAVLDAAIIRRNCAKMIHAVKALDIGFRAHVKTHKTTQITKLQMGSTEETFDVNLVVSTVNEIHHLVPLLKEFRANDRRVNVLYGIPLVPSQVPRLARLAQELGEDTITLMLDHPDQIEFLRQFRALAGFPACVFVKVDTGYHRAGLPPTGLNKDGLLKRLAQAERDGHARLLGVYSHSSLSYGGSSPEEAMGYLAAEIEGCRDAVRHHVELLPERELVISVGATPQAASVRNLLQGQGEMSAEAQALGELLRELLRNPLPGARVKVELHAGNYAVLDMQQVETNAEIRGSPEDEVALSVVAEVCSLYNSGERAQPEALLAAGTLALGREPCHSYPGWGVVGQWRREAAQSRLILARISQEHSILSWETEGDGISHIPLKVGQAVRVYPNHSCVTGAMYGWYLVVDSDLDDKSKVVDVWTRARGYSALPA
ncbi:uncharacterized protein KD926_009117 [Aspergillus affinis]|uniref:uncharacterized protein n=1 Tax=Aspergillus affinis TaxID=1070780 RepID=UPI0022FDE802|nr:uncharacterized protein KD926_009117 [Aspergillus affinis]KAI9039774.1 hypothetical protein KD926_009117 [Aspergillus affinis]